MTRPASRVLGYINPAEKPDGSKFEPETKIRIQPDSTRRTVAKRKSRQARGALRNPLLNE